MRNAVSSMFVLLIFTACENKAQPIEGEIVPQQQEQHKQGKIDTHGSD